METESSALQAMSGQEKIIAQGNTLVKLENNTQMAISVQRPRKEADILSASLKELELYPSMAREALYVKPVGKDDTGTMKSVEGLSIRAAESIANRWTNSAYGCELVSEDDESALIAGVFLDYENNTRHVVQARVSKFYKKRNGQVVQHTPDRFDTVIKANQSKVLREVILRSLPAGLKKEYENKVRRILKADSITNIRNSLMERIETLNISVELIETCRGKAIKDMKKEELTEIVGLTNAIRDGEVSINEAFPVKKAGTEQEKSNLTIKDTPVGSTTTDAGAKEGGKLV